MTTIAYRDGVMAADTALIGGGVVEGAFKKIAQSHGTDGPTTIGCAGSAGYFQPFVDWVRGKGEKPAPDKDDGFDALVVRPDGSVEAYDRLMVALPIEAPFHAIGSGKELARGAMAAGATAEEAVKIACLFDTGSCEPVTVVRHDMFIRVRAV